MARKKEPTFESQMAELSRIVDSIGRDDCPVDQLEERVRRAAELIRSLRARLSSVEVSVREVLADLETGSAGKSGTAAGAPGYDDEEEEAEEEEEDDEG
jgi:exodeoxyribonuclease VII small subunit